MSEETSSTMGGSPTPSKSAPPERPGQSELGELRKEVIETRNLIIKTDNLLKNLHAELKLTSRKQEQFERRHLLTSTTAFIMIHSLCCGNASTRSSLAMKTPTTPTACGTIRSYRSSPIRSWVTPSAPSPFSVLLARPSSPEKIVV